MHLWRQVVLLNQLKSTLPFIVTKSCCPAVKCNHVTKHNYYSRWKKASFASWAAKRRTYQAGLDRSCDSIMCQAAEPTCWCEANSLGVRIKPEKVTGAWLLLVCPADRAWSQGLAGALVLELAPNQTHDWLFSHKANSQIRWHTITLLSIVVPRIRRMHFFSPPQVSLPQHTEFTPSHHISHYIEMMMNTTVSV